MNMTIGKNVVCAGIGVLLTFGSAGAAAAERTSLKEKFPEAGGVIPLIEGFPLLKTLLERDDPWQGHPVRLEERLFPQEVTLAQGSKETPLLFNGQRSESWPGLAVWNQSACETDDCVANPVRPAIRLHLGRASHRRPELAPSLDQAAGAQVSSNIKRIVEGLRPYGAGQLPLKHPSIAQYLLPGGAHAAKND